MNKFFKAPSLSRDFETFVREYPDLTGSDEDYILTFFKQDHIKKIIQVSLVLVGWTLAYGPIDALFLGTTTVQMVSSGFEILNYIQWIAVTILNMVAKYIFVTWYDTDNEFTVAQRLCTCVPVVGVLLFLGSVLKDDKLLLLVIRSYVKHVRKRGLRSLFGMISR